MFALILSLFFSLLAYSQELIREKDKFILSAPSCPLLIKQMEALQTWKNQRENVSEDCSTSSVERTANGCSAEVTSCLPQIVSELHGTTSEWDGPNCFNIAMVTSGFMKHKIHEGGDTFQHYVNSPLCRTLEVDESPLPGDIGVVATQSDRFGLDFSHGFTWISPQMVFSKNGLATKHHYRVQSFEEMYQNEVELLNCRDSMDLACEELKVVSYRCKSFEDYLSNSSGISDKLRISLSHIEKAESCFEQAYFTEGPGPSESFASSIRSYLEPLKFYLNEQNPKSPEDVFLLGMLKLRLKALESQETSD